MGLFCELADLHNESDVEQKFLINIITKKPPMGLGFSAVDVRTKTNLRQILIGKGASAKLYYPDYLVVLDGFPGLVVEAKRPSEDIYSLINEARLYAAELNAQFPHKLNPCSKIVMSNGKRIIASYWDAKTIDHDLGFEEVYVESEKYSKFIEFVSKDAVKESIDSIKGRLKNNSFFTKPLRIIGGFTVQNEELEANGFGTNLTLKYGNLFNPETPKDRKEVVENAYVPSKRRLKHVDPIQKIIRAAKLPSEVRAVTIEDTTKPNEIISQLQEENLVGKVMLLIGGVGSGKSTFVDYLQNIGIPPEMQGSLTWAHLDLNTAPLAKEKIYDWILSKIISELKKSHVSIDFDDLETIKKVYFVEIRKIEKGLGALLDKDSITYKELLAKEMLGWQGNLSVTVKALTQFLCRSRGKNLIVVLDNCDRRTKEAQLLMFEVAKWLQKEVDCLIFLPIRDTTYDNHCKEPPLDTVVKDLTFRIDPPKLMEVIYKRVNYVLSKMKSGNEKELSYVLGGGMSVVYPESEQAVYLACILRSIFSTDTYARRVMTGIVGRDIRKGIELFLSFCKSGHISNEEIFKMRIMPSEYSLPHHVLMKVLLRGTRKYYHDSNSIVKNLFNSYPEDIVPDPFIRLDILLWLKDMYQVNGPNNIRGFHRIGQLICDLIALGHEESRIRKELGALIAAGCVVTESQGEGVYDESDLAAISPSGHVHLDMVETSLYLAASSEDVWYKNSGAAQSIAKRMTGEDGEGIHSITTTFDNAATLIKYLEEYYKEMFVSDPKYYLKGIGPTTLNALERIKGKLNEQENSLKSLIDEERLVAKYKYGMYVTGNITAFNKCGAYVEFDGDVRGFVWNDNLEKIKSMGQNISVGSSQQFVVVGYNSRHRRFTLRV